MRFVGIIPARYASSRYPGKPLADMDGKPMIQRVYEQVSLELEHVYVATDDNQIFDTVKAFGGNAIITSSDHQSGTDRCYEAYTKLDEAFDVVINIQGDEPFIHPSQLQTIKNCFDESNTQIASLVKPFSSSDSFDSLANPNSPKVVLNKNNEAIYFSRSIIPFCRGAETNEWLNNQTYYKHIGLYAYKSDVLKEITSLPQSKLELSESLEQLRWLENGFRIKMGITTLETIGIDTPEDMERAIIFLKKINQC